jgi:sec-independent protein translocase protein TatA
MPTLGGSEWLILLLIVLVLFGGAKIPQLMRGVGEGMRELKKAQRDDPETTRTTETTSPRSDDRAPTV